MIQSHQASDVTSEATDTFNFVPRHHSTRPLSVQASPVITATPTQLGVSENQSMQNSRVFDEIETEIIRFESVHPFIYQLYEIFGRMPVDGLQQELTSLVTQIEDAFVNSEEWTLSRAVESLRIGVVGALESGKTSFVHYFLTGNIALQCSPEGGRFKKCVHIDGRPFLVRIRDEGCCPPEFQFTHWADGMMIVFSVMSRSSYSTALQYFRQMTSYRNLNDVPVFLIGTLDQPIDENGECIETAIREVSTDEARSAVVTLKLNDYFECFTYVADVNDVFQAVFWQILQKQRVGQFQAPKHRYSLNGNLASNIGRAQELHYQQSPAYNLSNRKSGNNCTTYHHQRSVSAVPLPPSKSNVSRTTPLPPQHQSLPQQLSPSDTTIVAPTTRNASRSALKRHNVLYYSNRANNHQYAVPQPLHKFSSRSNNTSIQSAYSCSLASVPSAYQDIVTDSSMAFPRSDSMLSNGMDVSDGYNIKPQLRRDNNGRCSERASCSSFMPSSSVASRHCEHHANWTHHNSERISTPEIGGSSTTLGSFMCAGISPAYSHSSLASQLSLTSGNGPQYSRSSSSVVENFRNSAPPPPLPPPPPPNIRAGAFPHYNENVSTSSLYAANGSAVFTNSLSAGIGLAAGNSASPVVTPNTQRKNRRISNIFRTHKEHNYNSNGNTPDLNSLGGVPLSSASSIPKANLCSSSALLNDVVPGMGVGREIPVREGYLYKKSNKALNREWKKKYVCLYADGTMKYYSSNKDYRNDHKGKSLYVGLATVRLRRPKTSVRNSLLPQSSAQNQAGSAGDLKQETVDKLVDNEISTAGEAGTSGASDCVISSNLQRVSLAGSTIVTGQLHHQDLTSTSGGNDQSSAQNRQQQANDLSAEASSSPSKSASLGRNNGPAAKPMTNVAAAAAVAKKKHKRLGSGTKNNEDEEDCEFELISSDEKHWEFAAQTADERADWVRQIEELIEKCLQSQTSQKQQLNAKAHGDKADVAALRNLSGNDICADCGQSHPDWASLNLGTLICIECSGIHRNLGSHISRVRSLDLDDWPNEYLHVMQIIGNQKANSIWEFGAPSAEKPTSSSSRDVKEAWIKRKYEQKAFMPPLSDDLKKERVFSAGQLIIKAVLTRNVDVLLRTLPRATEDDVNMTVGAANLDEVTATVAVTSSALTTSGYDNNDTRRLDRRTALHLACSRDAPDILQLLIWYNANIRALDENSKSALWYSRIASSTGCRAILLNAGLEPNYGMDGVSSDVGNSNARVEKKQIGSEFDARALKNEIGVADVHLQISRLSVEAAEAARNLRHRADKSDAHTADNNITGGNRELTAKRTPMSESMISML